MVERKKVMNVKELERWLVNKGAVPVNEEIKKKPWYGAVCKLPPCMVDRKSLPQQTAEESAEYSGKPKQYWDKR